MGDHRNDLVHLVDPNRMGKALTLFYVILLKSLLYLICDAVFCPKILD